MNYTIKTEINAPLLKIAELVGDHKKMKLWMTELRDYEVINGSGRDVGSKTILTVDAGGERKVTETIMSIQFPHQFLVKFEMESAKLLVRTRLEKIGEKSTLHIMEHEFTFKGVLRIAASLAKPAFIKRSKTMAANFKQLAEGGGK